MAEQRILKGRPKLKTGKRVRKIDARFTEEEYLKITGLEQALGLSKTELIRVRLLNDADRIVVNSRELIRQLDGIGAEMGRAGNNINQLARHTNALNLAGNIPPVVAEKFNYLMTDYVKMQRLLENSLRKIIQLMGR
ncbi:plasmid mobilization protein [Mucilaginibacter sp. HD30]